MNAVHSLLSLIYERKTAGLALSVQRSIGNDHVIAVLLHPLDSTLAFDCTFLRVHRTTIPFFALPRNMVPPAQLLCFHIKYSRQD